MKKRTKTNTVFITAATGISGALALALSFAERMLIAAFPLPMGIKPGISNIIVMFVCSSLGLIPALGICIAKAGFAALLSGAASGIISLCGGLLSVLTMYFSKKLFGKKISYTGISVISAVMHNMGQLAAASALTGSFIFGSILPLLLISGTAFGFVTGTVMNIILPYIHKLSVFSKGESKEKTKENGGKNYG